MIVYKNCTESNIDEIYSAFTSGFSDYIIKMEMSKEAFEKRFFGPEGNELYSSFIAMDNNLPVGLILGGIKVYEGIKTMRCGTLCVHPEYRRQGISQKLFQLHKQCAVDNGCKQLFLEVIVGNDKAINFYKKQGYDKVYDLQYYSHSQPLSLEGKLNCGLEVRNINTKTLREMYSEVQDTHINWQNDFDYVEKTEGQLNYGVYEGTKLIAALSGNPSGKISFILVNKEKRYKGIGRSLIAKYINNTAAKKLFISFPNNASLTGFIKHLNFTKDAVEQYEMYLTL